MYDRVQANDMYNAAVNPPFDASPTLHSVSLSNPGLDLTTGATITAAALPILPVQVTGIQSATYKLPTSYQYSAGAEQALGAKAVLSVTYVSTQTRHQDYYQRIIAAGR